MLSPILERLVLGATLRFDVDDRFARDLKTHGTHPRPMGRLRFWLIGPYNVGNPPTAATPWELVMRVNPGGYHLFFDRVMLVAGVSAQRIDVPRPRYVIIFPPARPRSAISDQSASVRRIEFPAGNYAVVITSDFYQQTTLMDIGIPMQDPQTGAPNDPLPLILEPGYAYPFPPSNPVAPNALGGCTSSLITGQGGPTLLRGSVHDPAGQGIAGVTVSASGANSYFTDDNGQWVLVFDDNQPTGLVTVNSLKPDNTTVAVQKVCVMQGCETSLAETSLRGWVLRNGVGAAGATVEIEGKSAKVQTGPDGGWSYYLPPDPPETKVNVTAAVPGKPSQTKSNVPVQLRGTVLVPTFNFHE